MACLSVFWRIVAPLVAGIIAPLDPLDPVSAVSQFEWRQAIARLSPQTLYGEVTVVLLDPTVRALGPLFCDQIEGAVLNAPLPTLQSLLIVWPQLSGLVAAMVTQPTSSFSARRCGHNDGCPM